MTAIAPIKRSRLAQDLAERIQARIMRQGMKSGERLPPIAVIAKDYGVGAPTVREALKTLEALGIVEIRHGSGVYVKRADDSLVIENPLHGGRVSKALLLHLIDARTPVEVTTAALAAKRARPEQVERMRQVLEESGAALAGDDEGLNRSNMAFHREIAIASENPVLRQLLEVLTGLFAREQRAILDIQDSRAQDHAEHLAILAAIAAGDPELAEARMRAHLLGVKKDLEGWDPAVHPVGGP